MRQDLERLEFPRNFPDQILSMSEKMKCLNIFMIRTSRFQYYLNNILTPSFKSDLNFPEQEPLEETEEIK